MPLGKSVLGTLEHTNLRHSLVHFYPSWVTVQKATVVKGLDNAPESTWADVSHLNGLRGAIVSASGSENRQAQLTNERTTHILNLQTYHPEILTSNRVIVSRAMGETGDTYNVTAVLFNSQAERTRLELEFVSH